MSLFGALSVSASGMAAQRMRVEVLVENLANSETTRTPDGGPYKRKDVIFSSTETAGSFDSVFKSVLNASNTGVKVSGVRTDDRDPEKRYMPGHPDADKDGYVSFPRINVSEEMMDMMNASRSYQANISAMGAVKDMLVKSIDLLR